MRFTSLLTLWLLLAGSVADGQQQAEPAAVASPIPKLDADGPTSFVTGLAFSPDGRTLYAAGWDKVVRVWRRQERGYQLDQAATLRVPIGPGAAGQINALAVSADGRWLAVGGNSVFRHGSTFDRPGLIVPTAGAMDRGMREDQGRVFVFNLQTREVRELRGHQGPVVALAFGDDQSWLVSAGQEWDEKAQARRGGVRLWDVTRGDPVATLDGLPDPRSRPGLSLMRQSAQPGRAAIPSVAIAWGDDSFRVWDPNTQRQQRADDGRYNNTVAEIPEIGFVTGSASGLSIWQPTGPPVVRLRLEQILAGAIPRAGAVIPAAPGRSTERIALVAREPGREDDRLYLVDLRNRRLLGQPVFLWNGRGTQPAVAASLSGDIAVAGGRDHRILVYRAEELRQNRAQPQVLGSSGEVVRVASIARRGEQFGIVLSGQGKEQPGQSRARFLKNDRVFSVNDGSFTGDLRGWTLDLPQTGEWDVRQAVVSVGSLQRSRLTVTQGGKLAGRVELDERQQLGDFAVLPPKPPHNRPLLALAYFDYASGQPVLALFDAGTGERFRELVGHTGRITSVVFTGDGRFMATAADDQTVCVWSLTDLEQILGARGRLSGLTVDTRAGDKKLIVTNTDRKLEAAGIAVGDVIEGVVSGGKIQPLTTARELYQAISLVKPGEAIKLRRGRHANDRQDIDVAVNQGIDERKPLFTFFAATNARGPAARWIGWSPLGPYDSSDPVVEKLLGWHFNTDRAAAPVAFATVDQYRARFSTRGLLRKLLETGRPQLAQAPAPEPPSLSLWLPRAGAEPLALEAGTSIVLRQPPGRIEATSAPFPAEQVESIRWRLGDATGDFEKIDGQWRADLNRIDWKRGNQPLQVELTSKPPDRRLTQVFTLIYQPASPNVTSSIPARVETSKPSFDFQAEIAPAAAGEAVHAKLMQQYAGTEPQLVREIDLSESQTIREEVQLQPGRNLLIVLAENSAAMNGQTSDERTSLAVEVYYNPPKASPGPKIELHELVAHADDGAQENQPLSADGVAVVDYPKVLLRGQVSGSEVLSIAQYRSDQDKTATSFAGFTAGLGKTFRIEQPLALQPGNNQWVLQAEAGSGERTERLLRLEYRPRLPQVTAWPLPERVFVEQFRFIAELALPVDRQPYQMQMQLNGERLPEKDLSLAGNLLTATMALRPGDNRLELRLSNAWGGQPVLQAHAVRYIRPPRILQLTSERKSDPAALLMKLRVEGVRVPSEMNVLVNGETRRVEFDAQQVGQANEWQLDAEPVFLEPGENRIAVSVKDDQAESAPETLALTVEKRSLPVPEVVVLSQHNQAVLPDSPVVVEAIVRSTSPIQDIVMHDGSQHFPAVSPLAAQSKNEKGVYEYVFKRAVSSGSDATLWRLQAVNSSGRTVVEIPSVVIAQPLTVVLESVTAKATRDAYPLATTATRELVLDRPLPQSTALLSGYVLAAPDTVEATRAIPIQVWVNGFLQKPVLAGALEPGTLRRPFTAEIELTQTRDNLIEVGINESDLPSEITNRTRLRLDCATPNTSRRLHLLVIAVGGKRDDATQVRKRAVHAIQGTLKSPAEFVAPSFEKGVIHAVLVGSTVQRSKVLFEIGRLARSLRANDVAMIYYQGDVQETAENFHLTTAATKSLADPTQTAISRDELNRWFGRLAGAQLILLDVDRSAIPSDSKPAALHARWPADSHIAFFRFVWAPSQPAKPPNEPVLLTAWEQSARNSQTLSQIDSGLASFTTLETSRYPAKILYERHLPAPLGTLQLGASPEKP